MSVKFHEAFAFDSAQDRWWWMDHFLGDQVQDEWRIGGAGGTIVVVDQQAGGIIRLTNAVNASDTYIDWNNIRTLHVDKRVSMEARCKISTTALINFQVALHFDWNNLIRFWYDTASGHTDWWLRCIDGGAATDANSGVAVDTDYHVFRFECHIHGGSHVHFYIDGTETANSPINTNVPDDATDYLQPLVYVRPRENAAKIVDCDYVAARQDR